jgi:hypothetical protein
MHEGDHGILDEAHNEFEAKFGTKKGHHDHDHSHEHHDHGKKKVESEKIIKVVSAIVIVGVIAAFIYFRFI